jgi:NitT/TauT family transport system substrate-binding protein
MKVLLTGITIAAMLAVQALTANAQILIGGTPNAEQATAFVAEQEGIFKKHGIDGQFKIIPINPTIPAALLSNSIQIGVPTPTTFLQAVDNGIDLVIIAGASVNNPKGSGIGIVARKDSGIKTAKDLVGKRFGAPGLNAVLHVMVRRWLMDQGVDPKSVPGARRPSEGRSDRCCCDGRSIFVADQAERRWPGNPESGDDLAG